MCRIAVKQSPLDTKAIFINCSMLTCVQIFVFIQSSTITLTKDPLRRFELTINSAATQAVLLAVMCLQQNVWELSRPHQDFVIGEIILLLIGFSVCLTFPRRPEVYHAGKVVDGQWTVSAITHLSCSWCTSLLALAVSKGHLSLEDLPTMNHIARSRELHDSFNKRERKGKLAKLVIISHAPAIILQHVITLIDAVMAFMPQYCFFKLLRALENQSSDVSVSITATTWAAGLGLSMLLLNFAGTLEVLLNYDIIC